MGLRDRVKGSLRRVWSPITVWRAGEGSDTLVHAGQNARVCVDVRGEDDGTADRVEVVLRLTGEGAERRDWPLAELPPTLGLHEIDVPIPIELPPSCSRYTEYSFQATLHRTKGIESNAGAVVDVVARPEDVYWPAGARSGQEGADDARIVIVIDSETVVPGSTLSGRVSIVAARDLGKHDVELTFGATVTAPASPEGKFVTTANAQLARAKTLAAGERFESPFSVDLPEGLPPTLRNGEASSIIWQVRVRFGDAAGWHLVAMLDPDGAAGIRDRPSPGLISFLAGLDSSPHYN
jgi:hypothetical protein